VTCCDEGHSLASPLCRLLTTRWQRWRVGPIRHLHHIHEDHLGAVAGMVGIESGVVSRVFNLTLWSGGC
jgi:hypothetical protein